MRAIAKATALTLFTLLLAPIAHAENSNLEIKIPDGLGEDAQLSTARYIQLTLRKLGCQSQVNPLGLYKPRQPLNIFTISSEECIVIKPNESCHGRAEKPLKDITDARGTVEFKVDYKVCLSANNSPAPNPLPDRALKPTSKTNQ